MKILILGCKGQLGRCLNDQLINTDYEVIFTSREQIDISNFEVTKNQILEITPEVVINATAFTAVDKAEENQETADLINHLAVANIAKICNRLNCWLIHVSTDYVFDGKSDAPYKESDQTNPQGIYGETKLKGELAIQYSDCQYIIIRTSWVFSEYGNNFLKTMLRLGAERDDLSIVGDQIGCPTYAQDIAKSIIAILPQLFLMKDIQGIYHYCGDEPCSWYDFAKVIFSEAKIIDHKTPQLMRSINTLEYPTPAIRPAYSALDCTKIKSYFGINASDWKFGVVAVVNKVI
jgi:dTDP-4-dehydrorhamnose reductase|tara:strand:+ start:11899 stop:12771 length:873 start_codon:yes stop_codon:yes gene_type:complete